MKTVVQTMLILVSLGIVVDNTDNFWLNVVANVVLLLTLDWRYRYDK